MKRKGENLQPVLVIEPAFGTGPRFAVLHAGAMRVRLPINRGVPAHSASEIMRREIAKRIYELLDQITTEAS